MRLYQALLMTALVVVLSGCLGGDGSGGGSGADNAGGGDKNADSQNGTGEAQPQLNQGGTASNPAAIDYDGLNEISADEFDNHFRVIANAGDILVIESELKERIDRQRISRCSANPNYWTGIRFLDVSKWKCSRNFYHKFEEDSEKILKFGFPDGNHGYFAATLIKSGSDKRISQVKGEGGVPDFLGGINIDGENRIESFDHFNHYGYEGKEGETVYLQAYTSPGEDDVTGSRCSGSSGRFSYASSFGWSVFGEIGEYSDEPGYNCSDYLEYTLPADGVYHFSFRSTRDATGYFRATVAPSPL